MSFIAVFCQFGSPQHPLGHGPKLCALIIFLHSKVCGVKVKNKVIKLLHLSVLFLFLFLISFMKGLKAMKINFNLSLRHAHLAILGCYIYIND